MSRAVIDPYLKIGEALASDSIDGVTANAGEIATAASALGALAFKIDTAAAQLTGAGDLADARAKFGVLSEAIDSYMTNQHLSSPEGVRVAFCPMVLKPWLQNDGDAAQSLLRQPDADLRQLQKQLNLPFEKHTLDNGLDVLLHEDRSCPIVAVNLWYHVGSKNERLGHTGFAHLFEHLMFEGSQHHDRGYFPPLQAAGAALNGSTNADRTNYWEVVPSNALELALWMESDRMGYLLPALTQAKFSNQRDVVLNERRQNYENRPYGLAPMAVLGALFPPEHPYHWTTIGEIADLNAVQLDEVQAFFRRYYHPANASLAIAGDIDPETTLALARDYFGEIEPGPRAERVVAEAALADRRQARSRRSRRAAAALHLMAVARDVRRRRRRSRSGLRSARERQDLASLPPSRVRRAESPPTWRPAELARDRRLLPDHGDRRARPRAGRDRGGIVEEIDRLAADGPREDEMERGRVQAETQFVFRLQTVGGFGGKSDQLNAYNTFVGDPGYFERDRARYQAVTPASLQRAVRTYIQRASRVTLSIIPRGRHALAVPDSAPAVVS